MKKRKMKVSKRILILSIIISIVLIVSIAIYALGNYSTGYRFSKNAGTTLTVRYGNADGTSSPAASCWKLYRPTAISADLFVPTRTSGEIGSFTSKGGALGFTVSSAKTDGGCTWSDWDSSCVFGDGRTGSPCGTWDGTVTRTCTCNNPSPSCGGAACSPTSESNPVDCISSCFEQGELYWCNSGTCAACACTGQSSVLCGTQYSGPCGLTCSGTKCKSASSVSCGTTFTNCGCNVPGTLCSSGTCKTCTPSGGDNGCVCDETGDLCAYDSGQRYCG